jgi:imidazolonepropionase-like amidohydrolase
MRTVFLQKSQRYHIWAPHALTGPQLTRSENLLLEINGHRIVSVRHLGKEALPAAVRESENCFCLEPGLTLMPCLLDAHVHLALDGRDFAASMALWDCEPQLMARIKGDLAACLKSGIGVLRDGGDLREINLQVKGLLLDKAVRGPALLASGQALRRAGGYGSFLGRGYACLNEMTVMLESLVRAGADQLKVLLSGVVSFQQYGKVGARQISSAELRYIVDYARRHGLRVMAHASSAEAVNMAVEAEVSSIEHGYFVSDKALAAMARKKIGWIPTIIPVAVQARAPQKERRCAQEIAVITRTYQEHIKKVRLAGELGVPLGVGTDAGAAGVRHGINLVEEMLLYSQAGLSNRAILRAATGVNAKILGLDSRFGSIEVNKQPALIGVAGNPLKNLSTLRKVQWVFLV